MEEDEVRGPSSCEDRVTMHSSRTASPTLANYSFLDQIEEEFVGYGTTIWIGRTLLPTLIEALDHISREAALKISSSSPSSPDTSAETFVWIARYLKARSKKALAVRDELARLSAGTRKNSKQFSKLHALQRRFRTCKETDRQTPESDWTPDVVHSRNETLRKNLRIWESTLDDVHAAAAALFNGSMDETIWTPEINIPTDNHPELVDLTHLQEQERSALLLHHETQRQSVVAEASQTLQEQLNDFDRRNHTFSRRLGQCSKQFTTNCAPGKEALSSSLYDEVLLAELSDESRVARNALVDRIRNIEAEALKSLSLRHKFEMQELQDRHVHEFLSKKHELRVSEEKNALRLGVQTGLLPIEQAIDAIETLLRVRHSKQLSKLAEHHERRRYSAVSHSLSVERPRSDDQEEDIDGSPASSSSSPLRVSSLTDTDRAVRAAVRESNSDCLSHFDVYDEYDRLIVRQLQLSEIVDYFVFLFPSPVDEDEACDDVEAEFWEGELDEVEAIDLNTFDQPVEQL